MGIRAQVRALGTRALGTMPGLGCVQSTSTNGILHFGPYWLSLCVHELAGIASTDLGPSEVCCEAHLRVDQPQVYFASFTTQATTNSPIADSRARLWATAVERLIVAAANNMLLPNSLR